MDIRIRPFDDGDLPHYRAWYVDPVLSRRMSYPDDRWQMHIGRPQNDCWAFDAVAEGLVAVLQVDREHGIGYIDLALRPDLRGRGIGILTMNAFLAGPGSRYEVLEGRIAPDNFAALGLVRHCGFTILPQPDEDGFLRAVREYAGADIR